MARNIYIKKQTNKHTKEVKQIKKQIKKKQNKTKQNKSRIELSQESIPAHPVR